MPATNHRAIPNEWIDSSSKEIKMPAETLKAYLDEYKDASQHSILQFLHIASKYQLDPMAGEIQLVWLKQNWSVLITIDGWMKLINQHPHFQGLSLREASTDKLNTPEWMECCIYRDDRILPIVVKEYLSEVQTEQEFWQSMPRRMLRHRVIQQCARLAFGIAAPENIRPEWHKKISSDLSSTNISDDLTFPAGPINSDPTQRTEWLKNKLKT